LPMATARRGTRRLIRTSPASVRY